MRIAICDDEALELQRIADFMQQYNATLPVDLFSSARDLLQANTSEPYDLILLDIEMPEPNGYQIAKQLISTSNKTPCIIFVTKSSDYAILGYDVAFHYLLKPISYNKFTEVMDRAVRSLTPQIFSFESQKVMYSILLQDLYYLESRRFSVEIHCKFGIFPVRSTLKTIEPPLLQAHFAHPHHSFLVNLYHVDHFEPKQVVLSTGETIPVSRSHKNVFQLTLQNYLRMR